MIVLGVLLAAMAVIISACSSGGSSAAPSTAASEPSRARPPRPARRAPRPRRRKSATLVIWADEKRAAAIKPLAAKWATDNGVTVQVESVAQDLTTKFKTASQAGNPPDVVVWAHDVIGDFIQNGARPVPMSDTSDVDPLAVKAMTFGGGGTAGRTPSRTSR